MKRISIVSTLAILTVLLISFSNFEILNSAEKSGTIKGKVTYAGSVQAPQKIEITKDVKICGKVEHYKEDLVVSEEKRLANVVVKLTGIQEGKSIESMGKEFVLDQNGCLFQPHNSCCVSRVKIKSKE